eukprot:2330989-Amphidinium_carterae.1
MRKRPRKASRKLERERERASAKREKLRFAWLSACQPASAEIYSVKLYARARILSVPLRCESVRLRVPPAFCPQCAPTMLPHRLGKDGNAM